MTKCLERKAGTIVPFPRAIESVVLAAAERWDVEKINLYEFVEIGAALRHMTLVADAGAVTLSDAAGPLFGVKGKLTEIAAGDLGPLKLSATAALEMLGSVDQIIVANYYDPNTNEFDLTKNWENEFIPQFTFIFLKSEIEKLEHIMAAELREAATFWVPQRWGYDTTIFMEDASNHLSPSVLADMSNIARSDFAEAGRCLVLNLPTAPGFHAARAVEAITSKYYVAYTGDAEGAADLTMGGYVKELGELIDGEAEPKPDKRTIRTLRQIKDLDRNPLMHPRVTLNLDEAKILFSLADGAISSMIAEIQALGDAAKQTTLFDATKGPEAAA